MGDGIVQPLDHRRTGAGQGRDGEQGGPLGDAGTGVEIDPARQITDPPDRHPGSLEPEGLVALGDTGQGDRIGGGIARGMDPSAANGTVRDSGHRRCGRRQAGEGQGKDHRMDRGAGHVWSPGGEEAAVSAAGWSRWR